MSAYTYPIKMAAALFPLIALLITTPFMIFYYRKYGSIHWFRAILFYSFVLFCMCAYFLVILPLPTIEAVAASPGVTPNFQPFGLFRGLKNATHIVWHDPSSYLPALKSSFVLQYLFNILLLLPYGFYLRYFFGCSFKKTLIISFLTTLFFETTQITGLYGIYPKAYRCFDVDDLICNTLGGLIGFWLTGPFLHILPDPSKVASTMKKKGSLHVSMFRRFLGYLVDAVIANILYFTLIHFIPAVADFTGAYLLVFFLYFTLCTLCFHGFTFGKWLLNYRVSLNQEKKKWYPLRIIIRYLFLYSSFFLLEQGFAVALLNPESGSSMENNLFLISLIIFILYLFLLFIETIANHFAPHHDYFWGVFSGTCVQSTIKAPERPEEIVEEAENPEEINEAPQPE